MRKIGPLHTLVFDLDDTLYPEREFVLSGIAAVGAWVESRYGIGGFAARAQAHFLAGARGNIFDLALADIGQPTHAGFTADLVTVYRQHTPELHLGAATIPALNWAREHFRLALVSDGYLEVQRRKFQALALHQWIPVAVFSDLMGRSHWKPHPWAFEEVMRQLPGPPDGFGYVGDNPAKDFSGARALGWRTLRLRSPDGEHAAVAVPAAQAADAEIASLAELPATVFAAGPS